MDKAPEFCFLWINWWVTCMTKSEWASWAQFLGVVGSLLMTLYLPLRSEALRREQEKMQYLNERYALRTLKEDVVHFVGPLTNYSRDGRDLPFDDVQYGRILERIAHFDRRLNDRSAKILLFLIRKLLRAVDGYRHEVNGRENDSINMLRAFRDVVNAGFKPEDENYLFGRDGELVPSGIDENEEDNTWIKSVLRKASMTFKKLKSHVCSASGENS